MLVAAHIITAVQGIVSRNVRPLDSAVISLCAMQAGDLGAFSVLPGTATLVGTVRTFSPAVQEMIEQRLKDLCSAVALGFGAAATVRYERIYPATINTESDAQFAGDVAVSIVGAENVVRDLEPSMGAEDFSFMLQSKPGAYLRIGQGTGPGHSALHNSRYDFNDEILPLGGRAACGSGRAGDAGWQRFEGQTMNFPRTALRARHRRVPGRRSLHGGARRPSVSPTRAMRCRWIRIP